MTDTKTKTQKIIKVGNSYAVTLDKKFVDKVGLQVNDAVSVRYTTEPDKVLISKTSSKTLSKSDQQQILAKEVSPEFRDWVDRMLEEDKELLEELSKV